MIQDKRVDASRQFIYAPTEADMASGWLGDTIMVNGTPNPNPEISWPSHQRSIASES